MIMIINKVTLSPANHEIVKIHLDSS